MRLAFCTIASKNYIAFVRTLMDSLHTWHPDAPKFLLLVDRPEGYFEPAKEKYEVIEVESLPNLLLIQPFTFQYSVLELNTAVKPYFIEYLMEREGFEAVIYFDPDILVTYHLRPLYEILKSSSIVLTPHILSPLPDDGKLPTDLEILRSGTYNLGFIGVSRNEETKRFLDWWKKKLCKWCRSKPEWGIFVDQKWIDLVPALYQNVRVLRDPCYNVAYWNLHERMNLTKQGGLYYLDGQPVRFFHFSGIEIENLNSVSKHQNRYTLRDLGPIYQELFLSYRERVIANGYFESKAWPYAFGQYKDGRPIKESERDIYWTILHEPYSSLPNLISKESMTPTNFYYECERAPLYVVAYNYLKEGNLRLARRYYLLNLLKSPYNPKNWLRMFVALLPRKLAQRIQQIWGARYRWRSKLHFLHSKSEAFHTSVGKVVPIHKWGVNVAAYIDTESGVGQGARNLIMALKTVGIPYVVNNVTQEHLRRGDKTLISEVSTENPYPVNIVVVNADQTEVFRAQKGEIYFRNKYSVGYWAWEVYPFPKKYKDAFRYYDEIWVPSTYVLDIVSRESPLPVVRIPHVVEFPIEPIKKYTKEYYGLEKNEFVFLYVLDAASYLQRKNPLGVIKAFKLALEEVNKPCRLVLKISNPHFQPNEYEKIKSLCRGYPINILEGYLSRNEVLGLINCCDSYVSLHRAEGFGLTIAEAMYLGKPVIATAYSGNMDFMSVETGYLVPYKLVTIEEPVGPYEEGSTWAEPDIEYAARLMIDVVENPELAVEKGRNAAERIRNLLSAEAVGSLIRNRLESIKHNLERQNGAPSKKNVRY